MIVSGKARGNVFLFFWPLLRKGCDLSFVGVENTLYHFSELEFL